MAKKNKKNSESEEIHEVRVNTYKEPESFKDTKEMLDFHQRIVEAGPMLNPMEVTRRAKISLFNDLYELHLSRRVLHQASMGYHPETMQVISAEIVLIIEMAQSLARETGINLVVGEEND